MPHPDPVSATSLVEGAISMDRCWLRRLIHPKLFFLFFPFLFMEIQVLKKTKRSTCLLVFNGCMLSLGVFLQNNQTFPSKCLHDKPQGGYCNFPYLENTMTTLQIIPKFSINFFRSNYIELPKVYLIIDGNKISKN